MAHEEYLRRNLVHAGACGLAAGIAYAVDRIKNAEASTDWVVAQLEGLSDRASASHKELAQWRNAAPDAPHHIRGPG